MQISSPNTAIPNIATTLATHSFKEPRAPHDRALTTTLHTQFVQYGKNAREWIRKCEMLLPHIEKYRVWEEKGYLSIYHYAAVLAGMNKEKVRDSLLTHSKIADKPELLEIAQLKGLAAVRPIASIATAKTANFWAQKAEVMSKNTLETYVREFKKQSDENSNNENLKTGKGLAGATGNGPRTELELEMQTETSPPRQKSIIIQLNEDTLSKVEKLKGSNTWEEIISELLKIREEKLEDEKPETVKVVAKDELGYHSRPAPAKIIKYVLKRTNGQCNFPGCNKPHKLKHHTDRYALNKEHNPDTYFPLCREHERLAHLGLIENEENDPSTWKIRAEADTTDARYKIDQKVQKFRQQKKRLVVGERAKEPGCAK